MMYSLGDIKFKKPVSLKKVMYMTLFLIIWTIPLFLIFGVILNPFYFIVLLAPPIVLANFASKPVWGGRGLFDFIKVLSRYIASPKSWADTKKADHLIDGEFFFVESNIWISRRRELQFLADLKEQRSPRKRKR